MIDHALANGYPVPEGLAPPGYQAASLPPSRPPDQHGYGYPPQGYPPQGGYPPQAE